MAQSTLLKDSKRLIPGMVLRLKQLICESQCIQAQRSIFDLKNKPTISFPQYLMRIFNFMGCSFTAYLYSLVIIEKLLSDNASLKLTERNIHRLLFTSIVISLKFVDDKFYKNKYYASVGGVPLSTLNELQEAMLGLLNYHCPIDDEIFNSCTLRVQALLQNKIYMQRQKQRVRILNSRKDSDNTTYQEENHRRIPLRQKRQRSRDKHISTSQDTQESHSIQHLQ